VLAAAIIGRVSGLAGFQAYPALHMAAGPGSLSLAAAVLVCALAPFADRRGIEP
jgi:hypothetical protein